MERFMRDLRTVFALDSSTCDFAKLSFHPPARLLAKLRAQAPHTDTLMGSAGDYGYGVSDAIVSFHRVGRGNQAGEIDWADLAIFDPKTRIISQLTTVYIMTRLPFFTYS